MAAAGAIAVYLLKCFATNGIDKNEKSSLIILLKKANVPSCAPPRFVRRTPERLYQPRPEAIERLSFNGFFNKILHINPPTIEPTIIPNGIITIFI